MNCSNSQSIYNGLIVNLFSVLIVNVIFWTNEPQHEISNSVVCAIRIKRVVDTLSTLCLINAALVIKELN